MNLSVVSDFFKDISSFLGSSRALGIDIGTSSIKLVEIAKKGENFLLQYPSFYYPAAFVNIDHGNTSMVLWRYGI